MLKKQRWFDCIEQERVEELWEGFPKEARREVTERYAQLMGRLLIARVRTGKPAKAAGDESQSD